MRDAPPPPRLPGQVIWITGVSGAGKTTLANGLADLIASSGRARPLLLDGDDVRAVLQDFRYDPAARRRLASIYGGLARLAAMQGLDVIVATISLFHDVHRWNRANLPNYLEVLLRDPPSGPAPAPEAPHGPGMPGAAPAAEWPASPDLTLAPRAAGNAQRIVAALLEREPPPPR